MKANILIVEDEEALTLLLRYNLEAEGYGVETVARGDEADLLLQGALARPGDPGLDAAGSLRASSSAAGCGRGRRPSSCRSSC